MKSVVAHAIKTNHFPEATRILSICWRRCFKGLPGIHFTDASYHEQCMMRGWSINHEGFGKRDLYMNDYINDNFDTGFLSPRINFALFCMSFILAILGLIWGA